jgi:hypothetical protein
MAYRTENFESLVPLILRLPVGAYFDTKKDCLQIITDTQSETTAARQAFPGTIWKKLHNETLGWWEYESDYNGFHIHIYGCKEAPASCRAIEEEVEVEEEVPVAFETRKVMKKKLRWECAPEPAEVAS